MAIEVRVALKGYAPRPTEAVVTVDQLTRPRRIGRALAGSGVLFAIAVVSVFIPVAHLLLVPGFLIAAVATLVSRLSVTALVRDARGTCPDCGREQKLDLQGPWRLPADIACRVCHRRLTLSAVATS